MHSATRIVQAPSLDHVAAIFLRTNKQSEDPNAAPAKIYSVLSDRALHTKTLDDGAMRNRKGGCVPSKDP